MNGILGLEGHPALWTILLDIHPIRDAVRTEDVATGGCFDLHFILA
jgi:hypothetical protein